MRRADTTASVAPTRTNRGTEGFDAGAVVSFMGSRFLTMRTWLQAPRPAMRACGWLLKTLPPFGAALVADRKEDPRRTRWAGARPATAGPPLLPACGVRRP